MNRRPCSGGATALPGFIHLTVEPCSLIVRGASCARGPSVANDRGDIGGRRCAGRAPARGRSRTGTRWSRSARHAATDPRTPAARENLRRGTRATRAWYRGCGTDRCFGPGQTRGAAPRPRPGAAGSVTPVPSRTRARQAGAPHILQGLISSRGRACCRPTRWARPWRSDGRAPSRSRYNASMRCVSDALVGIIPASVTRTIAFGTVRVEERRAVPELALGHQALELSAARGQALRRLIHLHHGEPVRLERLH